MNEPRAQTVKRIQDRKQGLINLFCKLIQAGGENPPGDVSEAANVVTHFLENEGMSFKRFEPVEGHASVLTQIGTGEPTLILCGHLDVVPAGDPSRWTIPPYSAKVREGRMFGRGATDMKGGVAAMLMAAAVLKDFEDGLSGRVVFMSVSDEEAPGPGGVRWLLENRKLAGDTCLITEPSGYLKGGYTIVAGERGICGLRINAYGKPSHGSTPMLGENAILMLTDFLPRLKALEKSAARIPSDAQELVRSGKSVLAKVARDRGIPAENLAKALDHYTVNVGTISGGTKINVVPEKCEAEVDIRVPVGEHPEDVEEFVRAIIPENFEFRVINRAAPSYTPARCPLIGVLQEHGRRIFGHKPPAIYWTATSDARKFRELLGIPTVTFGPGYVEVAHAYDEFVYIEDVINMAKVYANVIVNYLDLLSSSPHQRE